MTALTTTNTTDMSIAELAAITGDLSKLSPDQRMEYYGAVCRSVGLNPLTRPFEYINLNGKLTLYARKDATDQLRAIRNISIEKPEISYEGDEWIIVTVVARDAHGRTDSDIGVVSRKDMRGDFGNVLMKAITKAKRRATLSICGLGMLDETEVETIPNAQRVEMPPIRQITTRAPEAQSELQRTQRDFKALRECERSIGLPIQSFKWRESDGIKPLKDEIAASRQRLIVRLPGLIEAASGLLEGATDQATADQFNRYRTLDTEMLSHADLIDMAAWLFATVSQGVEVEEAELIEEPAL